MVVSHHYGFIFLHVPKCAGSSLKVSMMSHLGSADLVFGALDDAIAQGVWPPRATLMRALRPRSVAWFRKAVTAPLGGRRSLGKALNWAVGRSVREVHGLTTHSVVQACRNAFPLEFQNYAVVAVVRNPWDQFVSRYFWSLRNVPDTEKPPFKEFVSAIYHGEDRHRGARMREKLPEAFYFYADGTPAVDHPIRFESLESDWNRFCSTYGLPPRARLTHAKASARGERGYREMYNPETREMVAELSKQTIEVYGYVF